MVCDKCKNRDKLGRLKFVSKIGFLCSRCYDYVPSQKDKIPTVIGKVFIKDYGNVSVKRIKEMERRVILPEKPTDGSDYVVGRIGENGKVQYREPSY